MDIVDAQLHFGPGGIDAVVAKIDALGIRGVMLDEFWQGEWRGHPATKLANGAWRISNPTAELAVRLHPTRFTSLLRVDRRDSEVEHVIRLAGQSCHIRAIRCLPLADEKENLKFKDGEFDLIFRAARDARLPLFVTAPLTLSALAEYARAYPDLQICIDHCGLMPATIAPMFHWTGLSSSTFDQQSAAFDNVLALSKLPNVGLKWGHADAMFGVEGYPGDLLRPILRRAINAFGADRIVWASDASMKANSWAESLFAMRNNTDLSPDEFAAIMGGTLRRWTRWTGAESVREYPM